MHCPQWRQFSIFFIFSCASGVSCAAEGDLRGLILDYRNNGGGILQEAVKIVSMFVPKGTEVVTTKGRTEHTVYRTQLDLCDRRLTKNMWIAPGL